MKFKSWKYGFKIIEVPVIFTDRTEGDSKMSGGIFMEAVFGVIQMKLKSLLENLINNENSNKNAPIVNEGKIYT